MAGTQRKASPATATWPTDGKGMCVATSSSRFAASSRKRRTRTHSFGTSSSSLSLRLLFKREELEIGFLAPQLDLAQCHADDVIWQRAHTFKKGTRSKNTMTSFATRGLNARCRIHRIAKKRDFHFEETEFSYNNLPYMETRTKSNCDIKLRLIISEFRLQRMHCIKKGGQTSQIGNGAGGFPRSYDLIPDIFMNLAALCDDRRRHIGNEPIEKIEKADFAKMFGMTGRGLHVEEKHDPFLDFWPMVSTRNERKQHILAEELVYAHDSVEGNAEGYCKPDVSGVWSGE